MENGLTTQLAAISWQSETGNISCISERKPDRVDEYLLNSAEVKGSFYERRGV